MTDVSARIAAASGNAEALLALCVELAQCVSRLEGEAAVLQRRRAKDAARKRVPPRNSAEVLGTHRNGAEIRDGSPPSPSSSFPEPHITPSSPPSPQLPPQTPQGEEEAKLHTRAPEAWPVVLRFLAGKDATARAAWIGRFHGAMDRPPHPTGAELRDALEDLMTEPREKWIPALFRRYVERIRRDAERDAERATTSTITNASAPRSNAADAAWDAVLSMVPAWNRREVTAETHAALPEGTRRGLSKIGGFRLLAETPDAQRVWLKKDFIAAYRGSPAPEPAHV